MLKQLNFIEYDRRDALGVGHLRPLPVQPPREVDERLRLVLRRVLLRVRVEDDA